MHVPVILFSLLSMRQRSIQTVAGETAAQEQCEKRSVDSFSATGARTWPHPFTWSFEVNKLTVAKLPGRMASEKGTHDQPT